MSVARRRITTGIAPLFACAVIVTQTAAAAEVPRNANEPIETAAAASAAERGKMPSPGATAALPALRATDADETLSGAEPDPASFDRPAFEAWSRGHLQPKQ